MNSNHTNITRIKAVANALSDFEIVFVGGATVSLYTDNASSEVRPTDDVDIVIELANYAEFATLDEQIRQLGFQNDISSGIICRYTIKGIIVDIMPTEPDIIGFSNIWYADGYKNSEIYQVDEHQSVRIFSLPYFVASKLEAFKNRGNNDFRSSSDWEDIVFILENVSSIESKLFSDKNTQTYLKQALTLLMERQDFEEGIYCHLDRQFASKNFSRILQMLRENL